MHLDLRLGERPCGQWNEPFGHVAVYEQLFGGVAYADALRFGVEEDRDGLVEVSGTVHVDVYVAGAGFDVWHFGIAYDGLDESCSPSWDEHVDVAARLHHGCGARASEFVDGGDQRRGELVFGEHVGDDVQRCRIRAFGGVSTTQEYCVAGFDA